MNGLVRPVIQQREEAALRWLMENSPETVRQYPSRWLTPYRMEAEQDTAPSVASTRTTLYSMAQLNALRTRENLSALAWSQVGQNQKELYRERLLKRVGHAAPGSTAPAFMFNNLDWQNIFQLEALVEFYMNFNEPWLPCPPLSLGINLPRPSSRPPMPDNGYIRVNLLTAWHLVLVDSFGGRLDGTAATATGCTVTLDGSPNLSKVNSNFDTIYLPNDTARPSKTYRITAVNNITHTVTLDGLPTFTAGTSSWHIPAGVSGQLPALVYDLGPGGARGYDHFDGVLFVVKDGVVHSRYRWNSYTSRNYTAGDQFLSTLRGNKSYDFSSFRSANAFRNYSFKVNDTGAAYDGVREARFYFSTPVTPDVAPPGVAPNGGGKTLIRIHYSQTNRPTGGCSSAGCIVAGDFYTLRDQLINLYQADYAASHGGARYAPLDLLHGADHATSGTIWRRTQGLDRSAGPTVTAAEWNNHIRGTLWLVRPDERPLG